MVNSHFKKKLHRLLSHFRLYYKVAVIAMGGMFTSTSRETIVHLCKVLFRDPARPLNAELQRPAGVRYVGTLDQHPLDQQAVLRRVPDVGLAVALTVHTLKKTNHKHGL